ncbi:flavodoxin family protein [Clostridium ganghwense]|uniref:Flavodoxin n=1 Tax=Clostridium ganghwense TaxID=312089 RepID=A0ABT4CNY8_9CLOT|nr:flavodoxin [Clostridium ganghwense]MCY6370776.1 flavodoxin [Clostridium ganghwense]
MGNKKILVVFYSRSGITKKVAHEIKDTVKCDIEEIHDKTNRSGIIGFLKSGYQAAKGRTTDITPPKISPSNYDLVVLATPVWASHTSCAIRTYINSFKDNFKQVAFVATQGGEGKFKVFEDLKSACKKKPVCTLGITSKDMKSEKYKEKIKNFVEEF